jgi:RNA polymerase sigma-70 factor (ECF subfamily)
MEIETTTARPHPVRPAPVVLEEVARLHADALFGRALRLTGERARAWDLLQDTFERGIRRCPPCLAAPEASRWLSVVMKHLYFDEQRRTRRRPIVELDDAVDALPAAEPEAPAPWARVDEEALRAAVAALPGVFREVYELHAYEGLSYLEIAVRLGIPAATAATRLHRARARLRSRLDESLAAA